MRALRCDKGCNGEDSAWAVLKLRWCVHTWRWHHEGAWTGKTPPPWECKKDLRGRSQASTTILPNVTNNFCQRITNARTFLCRYHMFIAPSFQPLTPKTTYTDPWELHLVTDSCLGQMAYKCSQGEVLLTNTRQGSLIWGQEFPEKFLCPFFNPLRDTPQLLSTSLYCFIFFIAFIIIWNYLSFLSFACLLPLESQLLKHRILVCLVISITPAHNSGPGPWWYSRNNCGMDEWTNECVGGCYYSDLRAAFLILCGPNSVDFKFVGCLWCYELKRCLAYQ